MRDLKSIDWWNKLTFSKQTRKTVEVYGSDILLTDQQIAEVYNFYN